MPANNPSAVPASADSVRPAAQGEPPTSNSNRVTSQVIRAIVVDDSAFVRKIVREMLSRSPYIEVVGAARDGEEALAMVEALKPDVVTCDLMMPGLDGVGFVRAQMARSPIPILILSASPQDGEHALSALSAGAIDMVQKPTALATDQLLGIREELVDKVKAAARAPIRNLIEQALPPALPAETLSKAQNVDAVVLGISTGGPQALRRMLPELPANFPVPLLIVIHMPVGYTALFAEKLDEVCAIEVVEAKDAELLRPGVAYIAAAGRHLHLRRTSRGVVTQLTVQPFDKQHRPSVDVLFQSAAETFGARVLGVVMTGMGDDGREGAGWIKAQGGTILTEAEKSCIIYGMPRTVVESGLSDRAVPLDEMAQTIIQHL